MKILMCSMNFSPEVTGIGRYSGDMAAWFAARGHELRVVAAPPYYPEWKVTEGYRSWSYRIENHDNVKIYRCPIWVPRHPSGLSRIFHLLSFAISSAPVLIAQYRWRPDVVFSLEPPFFAAPVANFTARLSGACSWLHVQDLEIDAALDLGIIPKGVSARLVQRFESWLLRHFRQVSTISRPMQDRLIKKGVRSDSVVIVPNWVQTDAVYPINSENKYRKELGITGDTVVVLYAGNIGRKQGIEVVVDAAQLLSDNKKIQFVIAGAGAGEADLREHAKGKKNVMLLPLQPEERLNELLNLADIHVLPQRAEAEELVMPSKLGNMLSSGNPVVAAAQPESEVGSIVACAGLIYPPGKPEALASAITVLTDSPEKRAEFGAAARRLATTMFERERILTELETLFSRLKDEGVKAER